MVVRNYRSHEIYVGAATGVLKGVCVTRDGCESCNLGCSTDPSASDEISCLCWALPVGGVAERDVLVGLKRQTVRVFDTDSGQFTLSRDVSVGDGSLVSLAQYDDLLVTAVDSGCVAVWNKDEDQPYVTVDTTVGSNSTDSTLCRMRQCMHERHLLATAGRENDLQLWSLHRTDTPQFRAKNVRPDMLDLRVPVWVTDIAFLNSSRHLAVCHKYSYVRVYDTCAGQRRPVLSITVPDEQPLTCISTTNQPYQVVVGSGRGVMAIYDLRMAGDGGAATREVGKLRGVAGGVREVTCHPARALAVSVSLDRHLRLHDLNKRRVLHQVYLKSQLNSVLIRESLDPDRCSSENDSVSAVVDSSQGVQDNLDLCGLVEEQDSNAQHLPESGVKKRKKLPRLVVGSGSQRKPAKRSLSVTTELSESSPAPTEKPKLPVLIGSSKKKRKSKK